MDIRRGENKDYDAYCRLAGELDQYHFENAPRNFRVSAPPVRSLEYFQSIIQYRDHAFFVAEIDGQVVGYIHVEESEDPHLPTVVPMAWAKIAEFSVDAKHRRKGAGKALLEKAKTWSAEHGFRDIRFCVNAFNNDALSFCVRSGFLLKNQTFVIPFD